jgi:hypothetical protein
MSELVSGRRNDGAWPGVVIDLPEEWERVEPGGAVVLMGRHPRRSGPLRPTVTVAHTVQPELTDMRSYVDAQVAGTYATFGAGCQLVHLDVGHRPEEHLDLVLAMEQMGVDATVVQRHLIYDGGRAVVATGVAADSEWYELSGWMLGIVRSLRTVA